MKTIEAVVAPSFESMGCLKKAVDVADHVASSPETTAPLGHYHGFIFLAEYLVSGR
jgi:hypothetical protein